ncbi:hypothetical protein QWJ34_18925 [Saccharibacillus sp. CPCC 101409]|uniref:hypothetical protein n=1 Tax=Saccharibacillus sp. CPCC 101409 TaxID=3058041 RepID=UPI002670E777|nr:hypothetical protein [Saccharibacillus sp. CPCC 101409]MDO3411843.1 hypothetical protein [Saccharibacillus sp. CPCC 101409]
MTNKNRTSGDNSPILNECEITIYHQIQYQSVIGRKNEIYIPIMEELISIATDISKGKYVNHISDEFINEVISKQYKYRVEEELLNKLMEIDDIIYKFNKIDIKDVSGRIIMRIFNSGFEELYGEIIDGEIPIYDGEYIVDYDVVYPEEYENIKIIAFDEELLNKVRYAEGDYIEYENEYYSKALITMFEFALADRNKHYSPQRSPIIEWKGKPEYFIASHSNFYELYDNNTLIIEKNELKKSVNNLCEELKTLIEEKLKEIFNKYEKE